MALQTFHTNELIRLYQTCYAAIRDVRSNYPNASPIMLAVTVDARRKELSKIGAVLDSRSTSIVPDIYRAIAS